MYFESPSKKAPSKTPLKAPYERAIPQLVLKKASNFRVNNYRLADVLIRGRCLARGDKREKRGNWNNWEKSGRNWQKSGKNWLQNGQNCANCAKNWRSNLQSEQNWQSGENGELEFEGRMTLREGEMGRGRQGCERGDCGEEARESCGGLSQRKIQEEIQGWAEWQELRELNYLKAKNEKEKKKIMYTPSRWRKTTSEMKKATERRSENSKQLQIVGEVQSRGSHQTSNRVNQNNHATIRSKIPSLRIGSSYKQYSNSIENVEEIFPPKEQKFHPNTDNPKAELKPDLELISHSEQINDSSPVKLIRRMAKESASITNGKNPPIRQSTKSNTVAPMQQPLYYVITFNQSISLEA